MKPPSGASGVYAAEKYAELEARGEELPNCECHDESMIWKRYARYKEGGSWRCRVTEREQRSAQYWRDHQRSLEVRRMNRVNNREKINESKRNYYDTHPIIRHEQLMRQAAKRGLRSIQRMREALDG